MAVQCTIVMMKKAVKTNEVSVKFKPLIMNFESTSIKSVWWIDPVKTAMFHHDTATICEWLEMSYNFEYAYNLEC